MDRWSQKVFWFTFYRIYSYCQLGSCDRISYIWSKQYELPWGASHQIYFGAKIQKKMNFEKWPIPPKEIWPFICKRSIHTLNIWNTVKKKSHIRFYSTLTREDWVVPNPQFFLRISYNLGECSENTLSIISQFIKWPNISMKLENDKTILMVWENFAVNSSGIHSLQYI